MKRNLQEQRRRILEIMSGNQSMIPNDNDLIIPAGTELFHGTVEEFDIKDVRPGGYDNVFWTSNDPAISQTYIPTASKIFLSTETIAMPTEDPLIQSFQKKIGIDYDYNDITFENRRAKSYKEAPVFAETRNKYWELNDTAYKNYHEAQAIEKQLDSLPYDQNYEQLAAKHTQLLGEYEKYYKEAQKIKPELIKNQYVNDKLMKMGYKPTSDMDKWNHNYNWRLLFTLGEIQTADFRAQGRLLIVKPKRDLKIYDTTWGGKREGDLMNLDYHKHEWFRTAEKDGYDGIQINDFAQSNDQGNVGHRSIGLFKNTLKDVTIEEIPAVHQDLEQFFKGNSQFWSTPEYTKYKQSLKEQQRIVQIITIIG